MVRLSVHMDARKQIFAAAFISGACSLLVEIAGARAMAPYLGTTIYSWAAVIGLVLASLSVGYYAGGVLADRYNDRRHLAAILLGAGLATLAVPFLASAFLPFTLFMELAPASLLGALILVPASLFYGMVSPYCIKLTSMHGAEGRGAGMVFAVSTVGSIIGALGTGFLLIPNIPLHLIFVLAGLAILASSILLSGLSRKTLMDAIPFATFSIIALAAPLEPALKGEVLASVDSAYSHLRVVDTEWAGGPARVLFTDNSASSGERPDGEPAFDYTQTNRLAYLAAGEVREALVIGVAAGTDIEEIKRIFPEARATGAEVDAKALELGATYFSFSNDSRTEIVIDDGRRFVARTDREFDLVVIDAFRGHSIPCHLTTADFLTELKGAMAPDGIVVINIISSIEGPGSAVFSMLYNTFSSVFDTVLVIPTEDHPSNRQNIVLVASNRDLSGFAASHSGDLYAWPVPRRPPLTDELNPIELYASR
jgi:spermidine synthase